MAKDLLDQRWDHMWRQLARLCVVDELGGAEYRRCHAEWVAAGRPADKMGLYAYPEDASGPKFELPGQDDL